jgi:hypothetical protein
LGDDEPDRAGQASRLHVRPDSFERFLQDRQPARLYVEARLERRCGQHVPGQFGDAFLVGPRRGEFCQFRRGRIGLAPFHQRAGQVERGFAIHRASTQSQIDPAGETLELRLISHRAIMARPAIAVPLAPVSGGTSPSRRQRVTCDSPPRG